MCYNDIIENKKEGLIVIKQKYKETFSTYDFLKSVRGTWGAVNPVTKIVPDKTKYNRKKYNKKVDI